MVSINLCVPGALL